MMKIKGLINFTMVLAIAMFSYTIANAQVVDAIKDAAEKTKDVTVDAAKKQAKLPKILPKEQRM